MEISIRRISKEDAIAITTLSHQPGYTLPVEQTLQNINAVIENKDHDAFVAIHGKNIIGWIGVARSIQIEMLPIVRFRGLVVDDKYRKQESEKC